MRMLALCACFALALPHVAAADSQSATGALLVTADVRGAEVYIDGARHHELVPTYVANLSPGPHLVEVRKDPATPWRESITITAGHTVKLRATFDLPCPQPALSPRNQQPSVLLQVIVSEPEATVLIDGAAPTHGRDASLVAPGSHHVVVTAPGFEPFERTVAVVAGEPTTVVAKLRAITTLKVLSRPSGATVHLDGRRRGVTPLTLDDIDIGTHALRITADGYLAHDETLALTRAPALVDAPLTKRPAPIVAPLPPRAHSSRTARALALGRAAIDLSAGYPHYLSAALTVGIGDVAGMPADLALASRSFVDRTDLALSMRLTPFARGPLALGLTTGLGAGTSLFDGSGRNTVFGHLGLRASLTTIRAITVRLAFDLNFWSDRHCPASDTGAGEDICTEAGYLAHKSQVDALLGADEFAAMRRRELGMRAYLAIALDVPISARLSVWATLSRAPFQPARAAYTGLFSPALPTRDLKSYGRIGTTFKF